MRGECDNEKSSVSLSKRDRLGPVFPDEQEVKFVKEHYTKENDPYVDENGKEALWRLADIWRGQEA